jgi:hypothetical protein
MNRQKNQEEIFLWLEFSGARFFPLIFCYVSAAERRNRPRARPAPRETAEISGLHIYHPIMPALRSFILYGLVMTSLRPYFVHFADAARRISSSSMTRILPVPFKSYSLFDILFHNRDFWYRKIDTNDGADSQQGLSSNLPVMFFDNGIGSCKTETAPPLFRRKIGIEYSRKMII